MGKSGGFLTPKAIANRIKSKGLQKLRWYCQMCQKQCRDENGFKCHTSSESHQRQLLLFADNPENFLDTFSKDFRDGYMELLRRQFGTKRVRANQVYQDYINDRDHIHMNSTQWETLTDFVKWLGREGLCVVDETERGWWVTYIDRDPETIRKAEAAKNKEKISKDDEERLAVFIQSQVEKGLQESTVAEEHEATELQREDENEKIVFNMSKGETSKTAASSTQNKLAAAANPLTPKPSTSKAGSSNKSKDKDSKKRSALDEIMEMEVAKKARYKPTRNDNWLYEDIVVKIITKKLGDKYYNQKGVITEVRDKYTAIVSLITAPNKSIKLDQTHLETVLPAIGKPVLILNGEYYGLRAELVKLNQSKFNCDAKITQGSDKGKIVEGLPYEDISKLNAS